MPRNVIGKLRATYSTWPTERRGTLLQTMFRGVLVDKLGE